jgi:ankyrin repeat protein
MLHAIHRGQIRAVERLLARGATPDAATSDEFTPLMMAAGYGYKDIVTVLLDAGADPHRMSRGGTTALTAAVGGTSDIDRWTLGSCQTSTVKLLLDRFPDLRLPDNADAKASAWVARHIGHCSAIADLLKTRS